MSERGDLRFDEFDDAVERFDEFARGLAQKTSRREALRLMGGTLAGACTFFLGGRGGRAMGATQTGAQWFGCQTTKQLQGCVNDCRARVRQFPGRKNQDHCKRVCCSCRKTGRGFCTEVRKNERGRTVNVVDCSCGKITRNAKGQRVTKACCEKRRCCRVKGEDAFCCEPDHKCCRLPDWPIARRAGCIPRNDECCWFMNDRRRWELWRCPKKAPHCCGSGPLPKGQPKGASCCEREDQCCKDHSDRAPFCCPPNKKCCAGFFCIPRTSTCCEATESGPPFPRKVCKQGERCCRGPNSVDCCNPKTEQCDTATGKCIPKKKKKDPCPEGWSMCDVSGKVQRYPRLAGRANKTCCPNNWVCCDNGPMGYWPGTNIERKQRPPIRKDFKQPTPPLNFGGPPCFPPSTVCCQDGLACGNHILDVRCCEPSGNPPPKAGDPLPSPQFRCKPKPC